MNTLWIMIQDRGLRPLVSYLFIFLMFIEKLVAIWLGEMTSSLNFCYLEFVYE